MANSARNSSYDRFILGGFDPSRYNGSIWIENNAYYRLQNELAALRNNPKTANPKRLLDLIAEMQHTWGLERQHFQDTLERILADCESELRRLYDEGQKQYDQLAKEISNLRQQVKRQQDNQREIEEAIKKIKEDANRDKQIAAFYRSQAIKEYNVIKEDPYWIKYNGRDLNELNVKINMLCNEQSSASLQSFALDIVSIIQAGQIEVEKKRIEYIDELTEANIQIDQALQIVKHYSNDLYFDSDAEHPEDKIDVNHWSFGEFSRIENLICNELCPRMRNSTTTHGYMVENLKEDRKLLKNAIQQLDELVSSAVTAGFNSKRRCSLAYEISVELVQQYYFKVTLHGFDDDDNRLGYVVYMNNPSLNMNLRLILNPIPGGDVIRTYCHYKYNQYIDNNLEQLYFENILKSLRMLGLNIYQSNLQNDTDASQQIVDEIIPSTNRIHLSTLLKAQTRVNN